MKSKGLAWFSLLAICVSLQSLAEPQRAEQEPEAATGYEAKKSLTGSEYMISVANPYAAWIGKKILNQGGNAVDAAVAIQATLTLVEPQSSGIGGGGFMLLWDKESGKLRTFDGRETAPNKTNAFLFTDKFGKVAKWQDAVQGGRAVGVPGVLRMLEMVHKQYGKLPWSSLFTDAAKMAELGFIVSPRLASLLEKEIHPGLKTLAPANLYFYPFGKPLQAGQKVINRELAESLMGIAKQGADYFYSGPLAEQIVKAVHNSEVNPGVMELSDLAGYTAKERQPACGEYKVYTVCGMGPPSSGGLTVLQILEMLEPFKLEQYAPNSVTAIHLFTQASKLAFADRNIYMADTDFTNLPFAALINRSYLQRRAEKIDIKQDMGRAKAGHPYPPAALGLDNSYEIPNTSHFSIVDKQGNVLSMTTSIEMGFGSGVMVGGFLLNNEMTDFATNPKIGDRWLLNRIEPGKRPRSSMSPTIVFNNKNKPVLAIGSPGGSRIIDYVAQSLVAILDWKMDVQDAINLPKVVNRNRDTELEIGTSLEKLKPALEMLGHKVNLVPLNSGLHGIELRDGKLIGGADPRREGVVVTN
ncbi:gamma-glutamyltransferase [Neptunicella marina]|uniref:Glutathione hydrolase proenzyme n=1 Tax=Neptunicella marina TaxID=2125989 RepID=A0A8J6M5B3_9ALTE|nr:gamma-glutamyltransferase [Neptunicella marina]MBC3766416.1 gamma-glutamyltransferase [Neptunicella marina]